MKRLIIVATMLLLGCPPPRGTPVVPPQGYPYKLEVEWQEVSAPWVRSIYRSPVPGGWLIQSTKGDVIYMPDENHEWAPLPVEDK